jgi:hypothetical protein
VGYVIWALDHSLSETPDYIMGAEIEGIIEPVHIKSHDATHDTKIIRFPDKTKLMQEIITKITDSN